ADMSKFWAESGITKEMLKTQISNARCFSSAEYLESCRAAITEAKRDVDTHNMVLVEDDFDSILDQIDQLPDGAPQPKEWIMGQMFNAQLRAFDPHATLLPAAAFDSLIGPDSDVHYGVGVR